MPAGRDPATDDEVVAECTRMLLDYASHLDFDRPRDGAECFASDGRWRVPGTDLHGRDEIQSFLERRPRNIRTRHLWTNMSFDLTDPTTPSCTGYVQVPRRDLDRPDRALETLVVDARDTFVNEGGRWLILLHDCTPAFPAAS